MTMREVNAASPMSFDAWGKRREAERWSEVVPWAGCASQSDRCLEDRLRSSSTHGYTGHELDRSLSSRHLSD